MARRRGKPRVIDLKRLATSATDVRVLRAQAKSKISQRLEVSVYELRFPGEEPTEVHDFIMDAFVNDKITLGKARRMLAECRPIASIVEHEVE